MKRALLIFTFIAFLLAACGPGSEPTMTAEDVQGTAVAAAWTMVAETQAAIPTATPIPPTPIPSATPLPTNTVPPLEVPTQPIAVVPSPTTQSEKDYCDKLLEAEPDGPDFPLKIINETKAQVNLSLYLEKTPFGECGYRGYQIGPKGQTLVRFPQGVIYGYAWINHPQTPSTAPGGPWKPNNSDKWTIHIKEHRLDMVGP
jgi:hypothetical protein